MKNPMDLTVYEREYYIARAARFDISERELEVLRFKSWGFTSAQIADKLDLSIETVKTHTAHVLHKLKAPNIAAAAAIAVRERIIK